jgi:hypothetical protein
MSDETDDPKGPRAGEDDVGESASNLFGAEPVNESEDEQPAGKDLPPPSPPSPSPQVEPKPGTVTTRLPSIRLSGAAASPPPGSGKASAPGSTPRDPKDPVNRLYPDQVEYYRNSNDFIVGLIGFPGAGKTFFLNRLKDTYLKFKNYDDRRFRIWPPAEAVPINLTTHPLRHTFTRVPQKASETTGETAGTAPDSEGANDDPQIGSRENFVIFDIAGELFGRSIEKGLREESSDELCDAIAVCDALILVLPSDVMLGSEGDAAEVVEEQIEAAEAEFTRLVSELIPAQQAKITGGKPHTEVAALARLEARRQYLDNLLGELGAKLLLQSEMDALDASLNKDREALGQFVSNITELVAKAAVQKKFGLNSRAFDELSEDAQARYLNRTVPRNEAPLLYVAISKADALLSEQSPIIPLRDAALDLDRDAIDERPAQLVWQCEPSVFRGISSSFRWFKFDFLTTSKGQSRQRYGALAQATPDNLSDEVGALKLNYTLPNYGVQPVVEWLDFARRKSDEARLRRSSRWRAALGWLWSHPGLETELALTAALREVRGDKGLKRVFSGAVKRLLGIKPGTARALFVSGLLATALLGVWLTGLLGAGLLMAQAGGGNYAFELAPRYASEVEHLRASDPHFATGYLAVAVYPWSNVPDGCCMFTVPSTRKVRSQFQGVLEDLGRLGGNAPVPGQAEELIGRLSKLQSDMNTEYAAAPGGTEADGERTRPFVPYHTGVIQLRAHNPGAAASFEDAQGLLDKASPEPGHAASDARRLLGVRIATHYARGVALLQQQSPDVKGAVAELDRAREMAPQKQSARPQLTTDSGSFFYSFDPSKTPAVLNTASLWSDSFAAHIRDFRPADTGADTSALNAMVDALVPHRNEMPRDHPVAVNFAILGALLGKPIDNVRIAVDMSDPRQRATADLALRSLGNGTINVGADDVWAADYRIRQSIKAGDPAAVRKELASWTAGSGTVSDGDANFLRDLVSEMVAARRTDLSRDQRGPLLWSYGGFLRGQGFLTYANDLSPVGGWVIGLIITGLLALLLLRIRQLHRRTRESYVMLFNARHRVERLAAQEKEGRRKGERRKRDRRQATTAGEG